MNLTEQNIYTIIYSLLQHKPLAFSPTYNLHTAYFNKILNKQELLNTFARNFGSTFGLTEPILQQLSTVRDLTTYILKDV